LKPNAAERARWEIERLVMEVSGGTRVKTAVTVASAFIVTVQAPVPEQAPDQPANCESGSAVAVSDTIVPGAKPAEHFEPQLIPLGLLVTVPVPEPLFDTVSATTEAEVLVCCAEPAWLAAVTVQL
jgi:hypothetical protein